MSLTQDAVDILVWQWSAVSPTSEVRQLGMPLREHRFHDERRWRFDLAWPNRMVAIEVDGGSWVGGRHTSGQGFENDCEKLSNAAALGWRVLRVTPRQVHDGKALTWALAALGWRP